MLGAEIPDIDMSLEFCLELCMPDGLIGAGGGAIKSEAREPGMRRPPCGEGGTVFKSGAMIPYQRSPIGYGDCTWILLDQDCVLFFVMKNVSVAQPEDVIRRC